MCSYQQQIKSWEQEDTCSCANMRNAARTNWAHEVVRMSAVAPIRKQQSKKVLLHQDDPLSDGDDERPKKIRSYIKPSKNIDTHKEARRTQSKFEKLMKNHGLNRARPPHNSSMKPPLMRKERRDLNRSPKRIHRGPAPVARSFSAPSSSKDLHRVDQARSSDTRLSLEGKALQHSKIKSKEDAQRLKNNEAKKSENKRPPPPRPPLPEKRTQTSSASSFTDFGVQCDLTEVCPPAKRLREDELEPSANATSPAANSANPSIVLPPANEGFRVSPPANEISVAPPANEVETVAASTDVKWNEHLNLAYLFKRGTKIFTIDTLPDKEKWYKEIFFANTDDRNIASPIEKTGQSTPMNSPTAKTGLGAEYRNTFTSAQIAARDGGCPAVLPEAETEHRQGTGKKRAHEENLSTPRLKSCLMLSKKSVKRRISFSDDLVSVRHFEVDVYQEEQVVPPAVPPVVPSAMPTEQCQMRSERTRITSETGSSHNVPTIERRDPLRDVRLPQQRQTPHPPVVKQEPIDEDDDIVVLFSGKTEYIEELRREH